MATHVKISSIQTITNPSKFSLANFAKTGETNQYLLKKYVKKF